MIKIFLTIFIILFSKNIHALDIYRIDHEGDETIICTDLRDLALGYQLSNSITSSTDNDGLESAFLMVFFITPRSCLNHDLIGTVFTVVEEHGEYLEIAFFWKETRDFGYISSRALEYSTKIN